MTAPVHVERHGAVLAVTIDRPEKRNALSLATFHALHAAFEAARGEEGLALALLTGRGDRAFAAGGDLHELMGVRAAGETEAFTRTARAALDAIRSFPLPVVAAVNGDALGGGAELAMACDLRIAAPAARIGFLQGRLNIPTAWGGGIDLMRQIGAPRALDLLASARIVGAAEALALGLVQAVTPEGEPFLEAVERRLAPWTEQRPQVLRAFKAQVLAERQGLPRAEREALELEHFVGCWVHDDHWAAAERAVQALKS